MIRKSAGNPNCPAMRRKIDQLYSCSRYCENQFTCRRTMQLEFFGEKFDRKNCNKTCDNCKAGKEPEKRDLTTEARTILQLLDDLLLQKNGRGATLAQVTELYRGSKSKQSTKFLDLKKIPSYGAGKKFSKPDTDRIMHAMIFDRVLEEISSENASGFSSDYLHHGQNSDSVRNGTRLFFVEFPKTGTKATPSSKKKATKTTSSSKKKAKASNKSKKTLTMSNGKFNTANIISLQLSDDEMDFEGDTPPKNREVGSKSKHFENAVLPAKRTEELKGIIKRLVNLWAEEEMMVGKKVFYWNIMNHDAMNELAANAPMSIEELSDLGVLGENVVKEYGNRIIGGIRNYIEKNNLEKYIEKKAKKRQKIEISPAKTASALTSPNADDDFEFDVGIDFSAIDIPDSRPSQTTKKSSYFAAK